MSAHFRKVTVSRSLFKGMMVEWDQWLTPFQSQAVCKAEFRSSMHGQKEVLKEFSSRIKLLLDDMVNRNIGALTR